MKRPLSDQERFGLHLGLAARLWRAEIDRRLAAFGLNESRGLTLLHLYRLAETATQRELADAVGVRGPTLVHTLDWLEAEGLIERRPEACDRRTKSVHLRAQAAPVLECIETTLAAVRAELLAGLSPGEVATCLKVFEQIIGKLGGTPKAMHIAHETPKDS